MNYTSKYHVGQIVEYIDTVGKARFDRIESVAFSGLPNQVTTEYLMENDGSFIPESEIIAVLERHLTKQIELPLESGAV